MPMDKTLLGVGKRGAVFAGYGVPGCAGGGGDGAEEALELNVACAPRVLSVEAEMFASCGRAVGVDDTAGLGRGRRLLLVGGGGRARGSGER